MRRAVIFISLMLLGFTSCDSGTQPYGSHFFHDSYKVMYGEYEVTSVICFPEHMPEHLIEQATEIVQKDRLLQDGLKLALKKNMTYSLKESDMVVSSGRYDIGVYESANCEEKCYYYPGRRSFMGYLKLMDNNGDKMYFEMHVTAHEDKTKSYGIPWAYQQFEIAEGNRHIHYGIRYGLIYCEQLNSNLSDSLNVVQLPIDKIVLGRLLPPLSTKKAVFVDEDGKMGMSSMKMPDFVDGNGKMSTLSIKRGVFVDGNGKISLPSMKMAVFVDGSPG